jgi:hypothetical protein
MTIYLDPFWVTLFLSACIFFVSYKIGRAATEIDQESIIAGTIDKLIEDGYIAIRKTSDGDIELIPYKEINHVDP